MMESRSIELNFNRKVFEDLYNLRENGHIYKNRQSRRYFIATVLFGVLFLIFLPFSLSSNSFIVLTVMSFLVFIIFLVVLTAVYLPIWKWGRTIKGWLDSLQEYSRNELIVSDNGFSLIQDRKETYEKWESIASIKIEDEYVYIAGVDRYLFPKNSMGDEDFEFLRTLVSRKLKNGL